MPTIDRRRFLQIAGATAAATALSETLSASVARAASIPANRTNGSIKDVEHIVVLMQENRSFDHLFGTLRGVRGFGDPHPAVLPSGKSVWHQARDTMETLPFRPDHDDLGLAFVQDLPHNWPDAHAAFNGGKYDGWIAAKGTTTMAHLKRPDMPFHFALADAFTVCDAYHCSFMGSTDPNRYYMWTGWVGNDGKGGGPVIGNDEKGYDWTTYPERLEAAGLSWKIYQDVGDGLDKDHGWGWIGDAYRGNYGDNSLLYFNKYRNAKAGDPLYDKARTGTDASKGEGFFDQLRADVKGGRLPQISWIAAPEAFTEHPNWPVNYGAWYTSQVLDALTSDPEVWSKTALLITYDENDGFFDHVVPAYPNSPQLQGNSTVSTENEIYSGPAGATGPYGLGQRVPMLVVSPWSTGGWVCSETFDHTSIIRFMEERFGVEEPQITPWRRAVCGDLTSAFDFGRTHTTVPSLPSTTTYKPQDNARHPDYVPTPPAKGLIPKQEKGVRPSRALAYAVEAAAVVDGKTLRATLKNTGRLGVHLQARSRDVAGAPFSYTIGAGDSLSPTWPLGPTYDLQLHGPNGFFRRYAGTTASTPVEVTSGVDSRHRLRLTLTSSRTATVTVTDAYSRSGGRPVTIVGGRPQVVVMDLTAQHGWYDVLVTTAGDTSFARHLAGRVENGRASTSDPQLAGPVGHGQPTPTATPTQTVSGPPVQTDQMGDSGDSGGNAVTVLTATTLAAAGGGAAYAAKRRTQEDLPTAEGDREV
ncbi:phosphocholine-specific phospholipase C [Luteipulveratus mongoliensis]|uniref:phosphocholine-specific phospholipase C n=1 Tax=Luteipulveratus mongoliensis TaxID=571913 RepID=UPI0009F992BB|nr:phospholipase C, phosphocholine-specific [Luteipulveratus mongoliensis]